MSNAIMDICGPTLRFRLKAATDTLHRETERLFALEARVAHRDTYRDLLIALYGFHAPLEQKLRELKFATALDMPARLIKSAWIAEDLKALGLDGTAITRLPHCAELPELATTAEAFGALYVIEGATLGGQLITRVIRDRLGLTPENGGRFFASYGAFTGPMWRNFVSALDAEGVDPKQAAIMERAAAGTFNAFCSWLPPVPQCADV